jgi:hypothetical protein
MKREIIRVEPLSSYLEKWKAPTSAVTRVARSRPPLAVVRKNCQAAASALIVT